MCKSARLRIYDDTGREFYFKDNVNGTICFNLPKGSYFSNCPLTRLAKPVVYVLPKFPRRNVFFAMPKSFNVKKGNNPNKVSVLLNTGDILVDSKLCALPRPTLVFFLYHELGHYLYRGEGLKSEMNCDTFAQRQMLKRGYNPSQTWTASHCTLSAYHLERRENILNNLKHNH